jgi:hypothetical protein
MQMLVERKIKFIVNATAAVPNHFEDSILYPAHAHAHARQSAHPCSVPASQPVCARISCRCRQQVLTCPAVLRALRVSTDDAGASRGRRYLRVCNLEELTAPELCARLDEAMAFVSAVRVFIRAWACVHARARVCACMCARARACACVCMRARARVACAHVCVCVCVCLSARRCFCAFVCSCTQAHPHLAYFHMCASALPGMAVRVCAAATSCESSSKAKSTAEPLASGC